MNDIIQSYITDNFGLLIDDKKKNFNQIINNRINKTKLKNADNYIKYIKSLQGKDELKKLISFLTVGETFFLRNKNQWAAFNKYIIPEIVKQKRLKEKTLRIWSAGCSTGEEAYTIAIMLYENLPFFTSWDIKILASDINYESILKAKNGVYTRNAFRNCPNDFLSNYFLKKNDNYMIDEKFKKLIEFKYLNLISKDVFYNKNSYFDVIFLRNVLIYFSPKTSKSVLINICNCLKKDAFLLLGNVEGSMTKYTKLKSITSCNTFIYQNKLEDICNNKPEKNRTKNQNNILFLENNSKKIYKSSKLSTNKDQDIINNNYSNIYNQAVKSFLNGKIDDAELIIKQNNHKIINDFQTLILSGLIYINKRDFKKAFYVYQKALTNNDLSAETYMLGAIFNEKIKDYSKAVLNCQKAIFLEKNFFCPHFKLGSIYNIIGDQKKMNHYYKNALKFLPEEKEDRLALFCDGYNHQLIRQFLENI